MYEMLEKLVECAATPKAAATSCLFAFYLNTFCWSGKAFKQFLLKARQIFLEHHGLQQRKKDARWREAKRETSINGNGVSNNTSPILHPPTHVHLTFQFLFLTVPNSTLIFSVSSSVVYINASITFWKNKQRLLFQPFIVITVSSLKPGKRLEQESE